jgi:hypothetical protein
VDDLGTSLRLKSFNLRSIKSSKAFLKALLDFKSSEIFLKLSRLLKAPQDVKSSKVI